MNLKLFHLRQQLVLLQRDYKNDPQSKEFFWHLEVLIVDLDWTLSGVRSVKQLLEVEDIEAAKKIVDKILTQLD
mgnify:FL=1